MMCFVRRSTGWLLAYGLWVLLSLPGCGSATCEDACGAFEGCPDQDDCLEECQEMVDTAEAAGCESEVDDVLSCIADQDGTCSGEACAGELFAYYGCAQGYCVSHPTEPACGGSSSTCAGSGTSNSGSSCAVDKYCGGTTYLMSCDGSECTCSEDGVDLLTVPQSTSYCDGEHDARVDAATSACGWPD